MSKLKQLFGETFVYGLSSILGRVINFLLLPFYTRILAPQDYGVLNIVNTTFTIIWLLMVMALDSAAFVFFYDKPEDKERKSIFSSWFWSQFSLSLLVAAVLYIFSGLLSKLFFHTDIYKLEFRLIAVILLVNVLPNIVWNWLRSFRKAKQTAFFTLTQSLILIGLNIWFIVGLGWGIKGFFWAQIISGGIMSLVALIILRDWISFRFFNSELLRKMLRYSLPLVPTAIALWGLNSAGGYFLQAYRGETEVGLYQTGVTIAGMMTFVIGAFTQAWGPFAMSIKDEYGAKEFYAKVFIIYMSIIGFLAMGVAIFASEILRLVTAPGYEKAHWVASILAFNTLLVGLNYIGALGMNLVKDMRPFARAFIVGSGINLLLYLVGSRYLGKEGCALASLIANTGITVYIFWAAQKRTFIPYNFKKGWMIGFVCLFASLAGKFLIFPSIWEGVIIKMSLCLLLLIALYRINKPDLDNIILHIRNKYLIRR